MAATGKVLGTVTSVVGEAKATAADGTVRILQVGDLVFADEVLTTSAAGSINIALESGKTLDCGGDTDLTLHDSILAVGAAPAAPTGDVASLQAAIAAGADPTKIAEATAAGGAPAAGGGLDGGGGTPVIIDQVNTSGVVTSGFPTEGGEIAFTSPEFQLLPIVEVPPVVSVSVQVAVDVGTTPGEGPVTVPTHPAQISAGSVPLIEGTDGETSRTVDFVIRLDKVFDQDVTVTYHIVSGPADASQNIDAAQTPSDYNGQLTGTVTIPAGQTEFIVTVNIVQDHLVENNENFSIVLSDPVNATIDPNASTAVVTILDDDTAPVAHADTNWAQEDAQLTATGNVVAGQDNTAGAPSGTFADTQDTDADGDVPHVTTVGTFQGSYGSLALNADGTYTYTLNNGNAAVQGLDTGETLTDTFNYTVSDGVNTPSSSSLSVTIFGTNDTPTITVVSGAEGTVNEAALASGSNPASNAEFVTGSFMVADTDGLDDVQSVTINGHTVAIGSLVGATFDGSAGTITVNSFANGIANFTYELKHAARARSRTTPTGVQTVSVGW
ncbi:MAG: retention module-containing protein [Betaproteobacteria bacterium]|nr:retention module-containing protein [Betaproteobacteria bacterium]